MFKSNRYAVTAIGEYASTLAVIDRYREAEAREAGLPADAYQGSDPRVVQYFPTGKTPGLHKGAADYLAEDLNATEELRMRTAVEDLIRAAIYGEAAALYLSGATTRTEEEADGLGALLRSRGIPEEVLASAAAAQHCGAVLKEAAEHFPELYREATITFRGIYVYGGDGLDASAVLEAAQIGEKGDD